MESQTQLMHTRRARARPERAGRSRRPETQKGALSGTVVDAAILLPIVGVEVAWLVGIGYLICHKLGIA